MGTSSPVLILILLFIIGCTGGDANPESSSEEITLRSIVSGFIASLTEGGQHARQVARKNTGIP